MAQRILGSKGFITLYVDPADGGQVMAYYKNCRTGSPEIWTDQGYEELTISSEHPLYEAVSAGKRDCRFNGDVCTPRINPVQPTGPEEKIS